MDETSDRIRAFWQDRGKCVDDPIKAARFRDDDRLGHDLELVRRYCRPDSAVLDLGAGTCELSRHIAPEVRKVTAVDFVEDLLIKQSLPPNITTIVSDIRSYQSEELFDLILLFGVLTYLPDESDVLCLYRNISRMLSPDGLCIIKHQVGLHETVVVDGYSDEFESSYSALYRQMDLELDIMRRYFDVQVVDLYPPHLNRWDNTHFYAFVCRAVDVHQDGVIAPVSVEAGHRSR